VLGDLRDRASLEDACQGIEVVVTTANSALRGGADNPQTVDLEGNRNLIDAAKAAGVRQFVFVSAMVADPASPVPFVAAKGKTEVYLRDSGVPYTILAPNAFMEFWIGMYIGLPALQGQPVTIAGDGRRRHSFVSATDVGRFAVASIRHPDAMNRKLLLGGPEPVTLREAVAEYEKALGRLVPLRCVRPGEPVPGLPEAVWRLAASLDMFDSPLDMAETARTFDVELTSLREFVRRSVEDTKA
jgi:uncharacterized protein YbjT (DUF2867 family)